MAIKISFAIKNLNKKDKLAETLQLFQQGEGVQIKKKNKKFSCLQYLYFRCFQPLGRLLCKRVSTLSLNWLVRQCQVGAARITNKLGNVRTAS
jgi:hypothetical protein